LCHQVDGLAGVACEDNLPVTAGVDEAGNLAPRILIGCGGLGTQVVNTTVDVAVVLPAAQSQEGMLLTDVAGRCLTHALPYACLLLQSHAWV
jgi:hypothetical protein